MAKMTRERAVQEKRALKQEKKEARKQAALDAREGGSANGTPAEDASGGDLVGDESPGEQPVAGDQPRTDEP